VVVLGGCVVPGGFVGVVGGRVVGVGLGVVGVGRGVVVAVLGIGVNRGGALAGDVAPVGDALLRRNGSEVVTVVPTTFALIAVAVVVVVVLAIVLGTVVEPPTCG